MRPLVGAGLGHAQATGVGVGLACRRRTQKVEPLPGRRSEARSRRPSRRPSAWRSRGRGRSPRSRARRCRGRSARRPGPAPRPGFPCRCPRPRSSPRRLPPREARRVTAPGAGVFLHAFVSRPISTWRSSTGSPSATRSGSISARTSTPSGGSTACTASSAARVTSTTSASSRSPGRLDPRQHQQRLGQAGHPLGVVGEAAEEAARAPRGRPWRRRAAPRSRC